MEIYEIVCGAIVLLACLLIVILCMMQDQKQDQNMTSALGGGSNDSFYKQNENNTRDVALQKLTRNIGIITMLILLAMNIIVPLVINISK
ncbi:MAG: preprotein translocase subunit SecG [Oscillospiraceae bacterium]|nr:preprotein translocase subunit SecG [Oscillospiraceae bacterium]MDE6657698.1 preprotein translocase subunit SecG [Oscillospiraceae bacterium]